ncbi:MAG: helix-turn-helix transcriptional regulator, partial [Candidatus Elarobacter sp.]
PLVHRFRTALDLRRLTLLGAVRETERSAAASAFEGALRAGDEQAIAVLGASLAHDRMHEGHDARALVGSALAALTRIDAPFWLVGVAARAGDSAARARARALAAANAGADDAWGPQGLVLLCDAREAFRRRRRDEGVALAAAAAAQFHRAGWAVDEAEALEVAGHVADAVNLVRRLGASAEVRRLTQTSAAPSRRRGDATLTPREREIVNLVLAGRTAREIADELVISERTVETHVASVYRKLGVSNRHELSALVGQTAGPLGTY